MAGTGFTATTVQLCLRGEKGVLAQARAALDAAPEADLFVFPEFSVHGDGVECPGQPWAESSPPESALRDLLAGAGKAAVFGSLHRRDDGALTSRAWFIDPATGQEAFYDKAHVHWTEKWLTPGDVIAPVDTRFGRLGMLVCYDMAFGEAALVLGRQGADILCAISAIPRDFDWRYTHRRLAGAAIFNQFHVIGAHLGTGDDTRMGGHSAIFNAEGELIAHVDDRMPGHATAQIDLRAQMEWRAREMIGPYRRPGLYGALADES